MNNFRNQYVYPDSFQGKVYDYYRNPTNSIHFSIDNQGGFEQKENQQGRKKNDYDNTKKHSFYVNNQFGKINDSKPVMFSPPKVESIEKPLNENTSEVNIVPDKDSHIEKKSREEVVSNLIKEFSLMLEDATSIQEGFTPLPESEFDNDVLLNSSESTSTPENNLDDEYTNDPEYKNLTENQVYKKHENFNDEENNKFLKENYGTMEDKFFSLFSENDESQILMQDMIEEEVETYTDTFEDKFLELFSESDESKEERQDSNKNERENDALKDNTDSVEDKFVAMLLESDELEAEEQDDNMNAIDTGAVDENTDKMVDKFYTMLSESNELEAEERDGDMGAEDNDAFDENAGQDSNTHEAEIDELEEKHEILEDKFSTILLSESDELQEEKQDSLFTNFKDKKSDDDSFNKDNQYNIACYKEINDEQPFQKNTYFTNLIEKKKTITVKMPVLLTELETDIDINETIDLLMLLDNILKVEWAIQLLDCKVVLPSETVFLKGECVAEIEFSNKELENNIQSLKISIPWTKIVNVNWITVPDLSYSNQKEFIFQAQHEHDSNYHYEDYQKFSEPIQSQLKQVHFVWHQELNSTEKQLQVNGVAQLSIHFMQDQFIELDCYSK